MADANVLPAPVITLAQVADWTWGDLIEGDVTYSLPAEVEVDAVDVAVTVPSAHVHVPYDTWRPRWSPDGQVMLVCRTTPGDHDTDLSSMRLWVFAAAELDQNEPEQVKGAPADYGWDSYGHPEWAPDSESIAIVAETSTTWEIVWLDAFEFNTLGVVHSVAKPNVTSDPSFLPDGDIVCVDYVSGTYYLARIGNLATPNYTQILTSSNPLADPMISPDGDMLVYSEQVAAPDGGHALGQWALKTVPVAGGDPTTVLDDGNAHQHPTWLSARYVLFQTFRYGTDSAPHVARIATSGQGHRVLGEGEYPEAQRV